MLGAFDNGYAKGLDQAVKMTTEHIEGKDVIWTNLTTIIRDSLINDFKINHLK